MPQPATPRRPRTVDWDAAEAFYLALNPPRKYTTVGRQFKVSHSMVARKGRQHDWQGKAATLDDEVSAGGRARTVRTRTERLEKVLLIADNWLDALDAALTGKVVEIRVSDMPGVVKLVELLQGEATDRVQMVDVQAIVSAVFTVAGRWVMSPLPPAERRDGFTADLDAALGGLLAIEQRVAAA